MSQTVEGVLEHYGVKGMKWGVRRSPVELARAYNTRRKATTKVSVTKGKGKQGVRTSGGRNQKTVADAHRAAVIKQKARANTTDVLTNKELKAAIERMDLERRYNQLDPAQESLGRQLTKVILNNLGQKQANALGAATAVATGNPAAGRAVQVGVGLVGQKDKPRKKR